MTFSKWLVLMSCFYFFVVTTARAEEVTRLDGATEMVDHMSVTQLSRRIDKLSRDLSNLDRKIERLDDRVDRYHR
jgi:predicted RNase H-like nuclease (RuvC/YqgF family)